MHINIPNNVKKVLERLTNSGFQAFVVGGCVRDYLMEREPSDWDICTSALPSQVKEVFQGYATVDIGMDHGTVGIIVDHQAVEVTTFRVDGTYSDGRHPDQVNFTSSIREDLARRDFTVNAMAYSYELGLVDPFGGRMDLENKSIRCVGDPSKRFAEDSLRIMRGLRFAATLGFQIEEETARQMVIQKEKLQAVSIERIAKEFTKLIMGQNADEILEQYANVLKEAIKGLEPVKVAHAPANLSIRLALLFPNRTREALKALRMDNKTVKEASVMAELLKQKRPDEDTAIKYLLRDYGKETVCLFFETACKEKDASQRVERIAATSCWQVDQLKIDGTDLMETGVPAGPAIGERLNEILEMVIEGKLQNTRDSLMSYVDDKIFKHPIK